MEFIIKNISQRDIERAGRVFKAGKERHVHVTKNLEREITACPNLIIVHKIISAYDKNIKPIVPKPNRHPKVSVIMLVKDALEYTRKCLDSLALYTSNYELIIIDNGSDNETIDYLESLDQFEDYRLILNDKNLGVPYGWDQGIKLARHDYIAIINNDLIFTPNWLNHLQKCFEDKLDCALASPTTCFSSGLQCDQDLKPKRFEMSQEEINDYASRLEFGYVDTEVYGFAFLTHRKVIDKIGVFDWHRYGMGTAEEADFIWRARQSGFRAYWVEHAYVHHYGHTTFKNGLTGISHSRQCRKNRVIFDERVKNDKDLFVENDVELPKQIGEGKTAVVMVTLDRERSTIKTLDSLFKNKNIEVIVVDNNSEDLGYLKKYKVRLIKNSSNVGVTKAVNQGLDIADSKYIVIIHNDITVSPGWIDKAIKFMDSHDDAGIIGTSGWTEINDNGSHNNIVSGIAKYKYKFKEDFIEVAVTDGQCNIIRNIGIRLDEGYGHMHFYDKDLSLQYRKLGYWAYVIKAEVEHKPIPSSESTIKNKQYQNKIDNSKLLKANRKRFINKWRGIIPVKVGVSESIPILMTTYNRLSYTKKALPALLESVEYDLCEIFIFDNNSKDGTREYLESIKDSRVTVHLNKENAGAIRAKNVFLEKYKNSKYVAFVDNDSVMPKGWIKELKRVMDRYPLIAVQLEHYVGLGWKFKDNKEWFRNLFRIEFNEHNLYLYRSVGGSGELVRRSYIKERIPETPGTLSGWGHYLCNRFNGDNLVSAFYDGLFMQLLDMTGTNKKIYDFPDYKKELEKLGRKDFGWAVFNEGDRVRLDKIKNKIANIIKGWNICA